MRISYESWYEVLECFIDVAEANQECPSEHRVGFYSTKGLAHDAGKRYGKHLNDAQYAAFLRGTGEEGYVIIPRAVLTSGMPESYGRILTVSDERIRLRK